MRSDSSDFSRLDKETRLKLEAAALRRLELMERQKCIDPVNVASRASAPQQEVLDGILTYRHRYFRSANQVGKSTLGAREVAWLFEENHPSWKRPVEWGNEPLLIMVVGRVKGQVEDELWKKIKGFIDLGCFREYRTNSLQKVVHKKNGNTIIFASHHADNEAREKLQSYVAHYVWLDEMPGSVELIEELHRRVQSRNGYFFATFTPKVRNDAIRKFIDSQKAPLAHTYRLSMFDNPIHAANRESILAQTEGLPTAYKNAILYGDWIQDDNTVYQFNYDSMVVSSLPPNYSPAWRHVEGADPALKSKFGFVLLAEDPATAIWYVVKAEYVSGIYIPREMVEEVQKKTQGYNICKRVSDSEATWYIYTALDMKVQPSYMAVYQKKDRKGSLMKNLQSDLGVKIKIGSWCTDLIEEFQSCRWSDTIEDKIVNKSSFHLLDAIEYARDVLPKPEVTLQRLPIDEVRHRMAEKHKKEEALQKKIGASKRKKFVIRKARQWPFSRFS